MNFTSKRDRSVTVLSLKDHPLTEEQASEIVDRVSALVKKGKVNFVMDMGQLKAVNSAGLGMLLICLKKARKKGGELILANVPEKSLTC